MVCIYIYICQRYDFSQSLNRAIEASGPRRLGIQVDSFHKFTNNWIVLCILLQGTNIEQHKPTSSSFSWDQVRDKISPAKMVDTWDITSTVRSGLIQN